MKVSEILIRLNEWIPPETAQSYDNVGLQVGNSDADVNQGLVALDLTPDVVEEAVAMGAELIVTHHPLLFRGLQRVTAQDLIGRMVLRLASTGIAVIAAHTNLDSVSNGVSARLAKTLGLTGIRFLQPFAVDQPSGFGMGMIGELERQVPLAEFLDRVCTRLGLPAARYAGDSSAPVSRVAVCGGSGRDLIEAARLAGADAYVTADLSYHTFFDALDAEGRPLMALIDAGHYETEAETEALLVEWLSREIGDVGWKRTTHRTSPIHYHVPTF